LALQTRGTNEAQVAVLAHSRRETRPDLVRVVLFQESRELTEAVACLAHRHRGRGRRGGGGLVVELVFSQSLQLFIVRQAAALQVMEKLLRRDESRVIEHRCGETEDPPQSRHFVQGTGKPETRPSQGQDPTHCLTRLPHIVPETLVFVGKPTHLAHESDVVSVLEQRHHGLLWRSNGFVQTSEVAEHAFVILLSVLRWTSGN
jgi:hypothetical protein